MKKRIIGAIAFLGGLGWSLFLTYGHFFEKMVWEAFMPGIITGVSTMLYVYWTDFGGDPEISEVERENKLLKAKIEQKKLKKKLEKD